MSAETTTSIIMSVLPTGQRPTSVSLLVTASTLAPSAQKRASVPTLADKDAPR